MKIRDLIEDVHNVINVEILRKPVNAYDLLLKLSYSKNPEKYHIKTLKSSFKGTSIIGSRPDTVEIVYVGSMVDPKDEHVIYVLCSELNNCLHGRPITNGYNVLDKINAHKFVQKAREGLKMKEVNEV